MFERFKYWKNSIRLSLKTKMVLALSAIVVVLVLSSIISILEYRRMSNYVSEMIAEDINSINVAQRLANVTDNYNLQILTVIGDESLNSLPDFDQKKFVFYCDSLRSSTLSIQDKHVPGSTQLSKCLFFISLHWQKAV